MSKIKIQCNNNPDMMVNRLKMNGKLLKGLQAKGENVKTEDDAITYLLNHQKKQPK